MSHPYFDLPRPIILGHRGAAGSAPENTLASFARALEDGAQILETDLHVTKDGVPVLLHDATLDRTTNGSGAVADLSLEELQALDAAHRFEGTPPTYPPIDGGRIVVPSLEEAFQAFPDARFNIEIKAESEALIESVVALVETAQRADRTLLTAGDDTIQALLRSELGRSGAKPAIGASLADIVEVVSSAVSGRAPETDSMALQIPREFADRPLVTPELVAHCHLHGIQVHVWTINDPAEMRELLDIGVDGLVTDHPGRMARLLASPDG